MQPNCYNRQPFAGTRIVQNGWELTEINGVDTLMPHLVEIQDNMSKGCHQHEPMGEATLHPEDWNCDGCKWIV